jgi:hypothetical protein
MFIASTTGAKMNHPLMNEGDVEQFRKWQKLLVRYWTDREFRRVALLDPKKTLSDFGITLPDGIEVEFMSSTTNKFYVPIPPPPPGLDLGNASVDDLELAASTRIGQIATLSSHKGTYTCTGSC